MNVHEGDNAYNTKMLRLFEESNINVKTIDTEYANHPWNYLNENCFDNDDGLICVGGDEMFLVFYHKQHKNLILI